MRIAFFTDAYHPRVSGQVTSIDEFCKILVKRGHEVLIVCPDYPADRVEGGPPPFPSLRLPSGTGLVSDEDRLVLPWKAAKALRQLEAFAPEAVHVQTEFTVGSLGRRYARSRGMPVLSTCHTHYEMYIREYLTLLPEKPGRLLARAWLRSVYARDDLIVTPSRNIRDVLLGYGLDKQYEVIPTGVDETLFSPRPEEARAFRRELERTHPGFGEGPLLVYVGRLRHEKNLALLAQAFAGISAKAPEARLLMVGEGPQRTELQHFFRQRGLAAKVAWLGYLPRERLPAIYSAADVFVFPSKTETQGLVTIEAMLCGTPVVGVGMMGTAEILEGGKGGLLSGDDAAEFADLSLRLLLEPGLRARKAAEARDWALGWSIGRSCGRIEELYLRLFGPAVRRTSADRRSAGRASRTS